MTFAGGALLLVTGIVTLRLALSGTYTAYVRVGFGPVLVAAGAVLVAIALPSLARAVRGVDEEAEQGYDDAALVLDDGDPEGHGHDRCHGHGHHVPRVAWLLVLPLLVAYFVAPPALGAFAAEQSAQSGQVADAGEEYPPLDVGPDGIADAQISDVVRRFLYDRDGSLGGVPVRMVGFVVPQDDGRVFLTRFVIACCAADGTPVQVELVLPSGQPVPARDVWVEVVAQHDGTPPGQSGRLRFLVSGLREVGAPEDPYEV